MPEQRWRVVQDDHIKERRRDDAPQATSQAAHDGAALLACGGVVDEEADIEIAVPAGAPAPSAAKEVREAHFRQLANGVREAIAHRAVQRI